MHPNPQAEMALVNVVIPVGKQYDFHRHEGMNEVLYVIKGEIEQWVEDKKSILKVGDSLYLSANTVHAIFNIGDKDAEFLAILSTRDNITKPMN